MTPLIDEHVQAVGREVRELAHLHAELARAEARAGSWSLVRAVALFAFGTLAAVLVLVAAGVALFFLLERVLTPAGAAAVVAVAYAVVGWAALWLGRRVLRGVGSILLPRTRTMLEELVTCRDEPTNS